MNLTETKPKARIILIGIAIFIVIILVIAIFSLFKREKAPQPSPSPQIAPNKIVPPTKKPEELAQTVQEIRKEIIASEIANRKGDIILFDSTNYEIAFIPPMEVFFVTIYKDPAEGFKKEAQDWFKNFDLKQEDLCDLSVRFVLGNFEIRKTNPSFTSLPDGCTGQPLTKP